MTLRVLGRATAFGMSLVLLGAGIVVASSVDESIVDATAPTGSVTLAPGGSGAIAINLTVTGNQVGTATFDVYRDWSLSGGTFAGSNPQTFTVNPRAAQDPATTFSTTGTVSVAAGQADGLFTLAVAAFNITNTNQNGAKLAEGASSNYVVTVQAPAPPSDTTPPVLSLPADITAEAAGPSGAVVSFTASATDLVDGPVAVNCSPASGSTFALGTTTVICSATDVAGNTASASFDITVVDTTPPVVVAPTNMAVEATGPSGAVVTYSGESASDLVDGSVAVTCIPASGNTFALGATTVNCSATDAHGNTGSASFSIIVQDTSAPALTLPANITAEATGSSGAVVSFTATANDLVDGSVAVTCVPASSSTFSIGTTTVNCSATDAHGNQANGSFTVTVVDTTPPVLSLPADITTTATSNSQATVSWTASANDLVDGSVAVTCIPSSGSTFSIGTTTVNCSATDAHNNTAHGSFTVTVSYAWTGFYQPVDNLACNVAKAGSAIPIKFSLGGNQGLNIFASGYPTSAQAQCGTNLPDDTIETTVTAGGSSLAYDATANQYIYVWKTDKTWAGQSRQFVIKLADGTYHRANFRFTR